MKYRISSKHDDYGDKAVSLFNTRVPNEEGQLAIVLLEKWGLILAASDGEDSAGRQKMRELTPVETVTRAFDMASAAFDEMEARGLLLHLPDLNEINSENDAARYAKSNKDRAKITALIHANRHHNQNLPPV